MITQQPTSFPGTREYKMAFDGPVTWQQLYDGATKLLGEYGMQCQFQPVNVLIHTKEHPESHGNGYFYVKPTGPIVPTDPLREVLLYIYLQGTHDWDTIAREIHDKLNPPSRAD